MGFLRSQEERRSLVRWGSIGHCAQDQREVGLRLSVPGIDRQLRAQVALGLGEAALGHVEHGEVVVNHRLRRVLRQRFLVSAAGELRLAGDLVRDAQVAMRERRVGRARGRSARERQPAPLVEFFRLAPTGGRRLDLTRKRDTTRTIKW